MDPLRNVLGFIFVRRRTVCAVSLSLREETRCRLCRSWKGWERAQASPGGRSVHEAHVVDEEAVPRRVDAVVALVLV